MTIFIPELAPGLNGKGGLIRQHWAAYRTIRDTWRLNILHQLGRRRQTFDKCRITITRHYCGAKQMDIDNLYATAKIPLDALKAAGVIPDDNPDVVTALTMRQVRVAHQHETGTTIEIREDAA